MTEAAFALRTDRLVLRAWEEADLEPFSEMGSDPEVMRHFPAHLSRKESAAFIAREVASFAASGFGMWAVVADGRFIGAVGLVPVPEKVLAALPDTFSAPTVEVGWRLCRAAWGKGYASEAARASLEYGFSTMGLAEIVSFTAVTNLRSQAVMTRIGMTRDPSCDFFHPSIALDHHLSPHVLYWVRRDA